MFIKDMLEKRKENKLEEIRKRLGEIEEESKDCLRMGTLLRYKDSLDEVQMEFNNLNIKDEEISKKIDEVREIIFNNLTLDLFKNLSWQA